MTAKQSTVPLFVRIPPDLKKRIEHSATVNRASVSKEVARLLQDRLHSSLPEEIERRSKDIQATLTKLQLMTLETLILACVESNDVDTGTTQLSFLREKVVEIRLQRQQLARDIERRREEWRASFSETGQVDGFLAPLLPSSAPKPLEKSERRRLVLVKELNSRKRGARARLATAMGCTPAYISQLTSEPHTYGHRTINSDLARKIETALKLKSGMLDPPESGSAIEAIQQATAELGKAVRKTKKLRQKLIG